MELGKNWQQMTKLELKEEFQKCKKDKVYFISKYIKVEHQLLGLTNFELFPFQERIIRELDSYRFNILRKFRQAGCTTIACAYALHICVFEKNKTIPILSMGDIESTEVLARIKIMYDELPGFLKPAITKGGDNKHNLELVTGCKIKARPGKKTSGRGLSGYLLIIDEAAFIDNIKDIWKAVYPIIATGGRVFMLSTVNGMGNFFHTMWMEALEKRNEFNYIDIDWREHPQYNYNPEYEWLYNLLTTKDPKYDVTKFEEVTRKNVGIKVWKQEYEKEFLGTGETYIDGEILTLLHNNASLEYVAKYNNRFRVWKEQEPFYEYVMAADVAMGRGRDYSAFHIINCYNGEQVAEFYSNKTPMDEFAHILATEGKRYNTALVIPERNTIGLSLIDYLLNREQYENVWMDSTGKFGFQVTMQNKDTLLADMEDAIRTKKVLLNSERTVKELLTFIVDENGKVKADEGQNDDLVMSLALTVYGLTKVITTTPGIITRLSDSVRQPLEILKADPNHKQYWGGKSYEDVKWVLGK